MKVLFLCKAATTVGLGHLIRTRTLATEMARLLPAESVSLILIGDPSLKTLLFNCNFSVTILKKEAELQLLDPYDIVFFDMLEMSADCFLRIKQKANLIAGICPVFNQMAQLDVLFTRTKYQKFEEGQAPREMHAGLEFSIIQKNCKKIKTSVYEDNLELEHFPIGISMGGADAANKTLRLLKSLKDCPVPATFWVMLGEGYRHSYNDLINEVKMHSRHEVVLAKTNRSMWQILKNCILAILPGGITTYEAAYAGLPTINFTNETQHFLVRELVEHEVCLNHGPFESSYINNLNQLIEELYHDRKRLLGMHLNTKGLIKDQSATVILNICKTNIEQMSKKV